MHGTGTVNTTVIGLRVQSLLEGTLYFRENSTVILETIVVVIHTFQTINRYQHTMEMYLGNQQMGPIVPRTVRVLPNRFQNVCRPNWPGETSSKAGDV